MAKHAIDVLAVPRDPETLRVYTYADTIDLDAKLDHAYDRLGAADDLCGRGQAEFVTGLADHWNEINELHQFREGNTRSQAVFFDQLARHAGYTFNNTLMASPRFRESFNRARFHYQATRAQGAATSERLTQVLSQVVEQHQPRRVSAAAQAFPTKLSGTDLAAAAANPTQSAAAGTPPAARTRPSTVPAR
jgi:cell filamentation protein